jgi:hypothetical protein
MLLRKVNIKACITIAFMQKCGQAGSIYKALHTPWCHIIFGL